jgi:hypothetical protein
VLSYLDVVAPEGTEPGFLLDSLRLFEHYVEEGGFPAVWSTRHVALRFGLTLGLQRFAVAEYRRLRARALLLIGVTSESKIRSASSRLGGPLRIEKLTGAKGETYQLGTESVSRVAAVRPEFGPAVRIHISNDTKDAFSELVGDLYPHVVSSLTGLSEAQLIRLGGAEIIEAGRTVWRTSAPQMINSFLEPELPRQILGVWIRKGESMPSPDHAPTGAILPRLGSSISADELLALDLVQVQDVWLPLSEAGVHTHSHSIGLVGTERWAFVTKATPGVPSVVFGASFAEQKLSAADVEKLYGRTAADRARSDRLTMELKLRHSKG